MKKIILRISVFIISSIFVLTALGIYLLDYSFDLKEPLEYVDTHNNFSINFEHYSGKKASFKSVIIVPPTGGKNPLDEKYARSLVKAGFNAYILKRWSGYDEQAIDKDLHNRFYGRSLRAIKQLVKFIQKNHKGQFIGIMGTSVGALHATLAIHSVKDINAGFVIAGGLDYAGIISNSDQDDMLYLKRSRIEKFSDLNEQNYHQKFKEYIKYEPTNISFDRNSKKLGQILFNDDTTVPTKNQLLLKEHWNPDVYTEIRDNIIGKLLNYPHKGGVITAGLFHGKTMVDFFKRASLEHLQK